MSDRWNGHGHGPGSWNGHPGFGPGRAPRRVPRRFIAAVLLFFLTMVAVPTSIGLYLGSRSPGERPFVAIVLALLVVVGLLAILGRVFGGTFRSTRQLIAATGHLADGDYTTRVEGGASGSLAGLIKSFNSMAARLESEDERRRRLLADLGHELRTPLAVLQARVEAMIDGVHPADHQHISALLTDIRTMERLLEDLRTLSLSQAGALDLHIESTDLDAMATDLASAYRSSTPPITVNVVGSAGPEVELDPVRVRQVLTNLLNNASTACARGGNIEIRLGRSDGNVNLEITDDGPGIAAADLEHVFERFHTGDTATGSGIGLTLARELVQAHGGTIAIESVKAVGTTVMIVLPTGGHADESLTQAEAPE